MCIYITFLCIFSSEGTYNTALKAAKAVLEGEVARTEVETDYNKPRKRKKNKRYISSSSEEEETDNSLSRTDNVPCCTSNEVLAPDSLLSNKLKVLLKNKSMKTSAMSTKKYICWKNILS